MAEPPSGQLSATRIAGGRSNLTYIVTDGEQTWVLRRPPLGHVLATAHDMAREYRVQQALAGTEVPVPGMLALCTDPDVLGAPFYLMTYVPGRVYRSEADLAAVTAAGAGTALAHRLVDVLAALHRIEPASIGLADFGRPDGFLARQLRRWQAQLDASRTREVPGFAELAGGLAARLPASPAATIVHGDYRLDNVLVDPPAALAAVLDWEMSTLGDPLADLGTFCMYWDGWVDLAGPVAPSPGSRSGFPGRDELVERYAASAGVPIDHLGWYVALAFYKIAVILEGIHYRYVRGLTVGEGFDHIGDLVPALVERGRAALG